MHAQHNYLHWIRLVCGQSQPYGNEPFLITENQEIDLWPQRIRIEVQLSCCVICLSHSNYVAMIRMSHSAWTIIHIHRTQQNGTHLHSNTLGVSFKRWKEENETKTNLFTRIYYAKVVID